MGRKRAVRRGRNRRHGAENGRSREIVGIISLGAAIFIVASLISLQVGDGRLMGPFGRTVALIVYALFGVSAYGVAASLGVIAFRLLLDHEPIARIRHVLGVVTGMISLAVLAHVAADSHRIAGYTPGGLIGETAGEVFRAVVSTAGTVLLALIGLVLAAVLSTPLRLRQLGDYSARAARFTARALSAAARWTWERLVFAFDEVRVFVAEVVRAVLPERDHDEYAPEEEIEPEESDEPAFVIAGNRARSFSEEDSADGVPDVVDDGVTEKADVLAIHHLVNGSDAAPAKKKRNTLPGVVRDEDRRLPAAAAEHAEPLIVESRFKHCDAETMKAREEQVDAQRLGYIPLSEGEYQLPPVNILDYDETDSASLDKSAMLELSARLEQTLANYGVQGKVTAIRPGPVVTMYEFAPAAGTRLNKIESLADELAMVLEALRVRIVAPIPGKAVVGIEVPNRSRESVFLKEIVADDVFQNSKIRLPLSLGKNIEGAPEVVDLAKMPHLLVAGTTGSGKSVSINSMITSLLYDATPEDVRLIMVDPKMLELSIYEGIPHLLLPVVTDPKKANLALRWAVDEMERRYQLLSEVQARDIISYNKKVEKFKAMREADRLSREAKAAARRAQSEGDEQEFEESAANEIEEPRRLPYIVIVIDEFADLMMQAPKDVENSVARIAQKARAAGIHLILATQRPSTNVITGLIKANFPSRVAFHVASKVDSRVILDQGGAEALLGAGDMLFSDRGSPPRRLHGCFIGEEEVLRVVEFLKKQGRPVYNLDILQPREEDEAGGEYGDDPPDEKYDMAVNIVLETRKATISYLQRRLGVGYNKAAKMIERMERDGIVSAPDAKKVREVLVPPAA